MLCALNRPARLRSAAHTAIWRTISALQRCSAARASSPFFSLDTLVPRRFASPSSTLGSCSSGLQDQMTEFIFVKVDAPGIANNTDPSADATRGTMLALLLVRVVLRSALVVAGLVQFGSRLTPMTHGRHR